MGASIVGVEPRRGGPSPDPSRTRAGRVPKSVMVLSAAMSIVTREWI
jgi:hypothetical protein